MFIVYNTENIFLIFKEISSIAKIMSNSKQKHQEIFTLEKTRMFGGKEGNPGMKPLWSILIMTMRSKYKSKTICFPIRKSIKL